MGEVRTPVSIVCVYNDPAVLESCLAASIKAGPGASRQTEVIPVDNVSNAFASAGAALNHGARMARNEVVVFVHQDVYLHSLPALEAAARSATGKEPSPNPSEAYAAVRCTGNG